VTALFKKQNFIKISNYNNIIILQPQLLIKKRNQITVIIRIIKVYIQIVLSLIIKIKQLFFERLSSALQLIQFQFSH